MNVRSIEREKKAIVEKYGEWTAHNIQLVGEVYTIGSSIIGDEVKLRRILQIISDAAKRPLKDLRVLDLACLEGMYALELARHGAAVVGVEGREANIAKARFAKEVLSLRNLELIKDDVRNLNAEKHGKFDVVLCLGILYHLDKPDVISFLEAIGEVCNGFVIIDTHVSMEPRESFTHRGQLYWGERRPEHDEKSTPAERANALWASLDNLTNFCLTRSSLYNALSHVGFTSVYECHTPPERDKSIDRFTILAFKGERQVLFCSPKLAAIPVEDLPEQVHRELETTSSWVRGIWRLLPRSMQRVIKRLLRVFYFQSMLGTSS